jgi:tyrosyl-tRNA synthetase
MQGYDSYKVEADIELGGTEQLYTLLLARDIQQHFGQPPQTCITVPILRGLDGNRRMGKSLNNYIGVSEDSYEIFAKTMSIPDTLLSDWTSRLGYCREG